MLIKETKEPFQTSYHKISRGLESAELGVNTSVAFKFDRQVRSYAAENPAKSQNDWEF